MSNNVHQGSGLKGCDSVAGQESEPVNQQSNIAF